MFAYLSLSPFLNARLAQSSVVEVSRLVVAIMLLVCAGAGFHSDDALGQERGDDRVEQLKAVYLYNYGNYVAWPDAAFGKVGSHAEPFVIGILSDAHPVAAILNKIAEKRSIGSRPIKTLLIEDVSSYWKCQILYIPATAKEASVKAAMKQIRTKPILVVTEDVDFGAAGGSGMINFYLSGRSIKFQIDPKLIMSRDMKPSSKLIQLGTVVQRNITARAE